MTTELTLREKVQNVLIEIMRDDVNSEAPLNAIFSLLAATGAPAYCRVAQDLRGDWVEGEDGE